MGNAKSMSSITSSSSREQVSTTTTTTTTTATKTIRPTNIHIPFKPAVMMSTINSSRKFYLNLSELKSGSGNSGDQSTKLVSSSSFEPSPTSSYTDEEYTSLNEIIESIESFPNMTTTVRVDDNYANLDFKDENNNNKSSFFGDKPSNRFSTLFSQPIPKELDSQLYSNVRLISCDKLSGGGERPKRRRAKLNQQQSSTLTECHKRISINLASLHLLTANLLSKLSKNVQKRQENASQQQSTKKCDNTETKKTSSTTKQSQNDLVILIPPPQKAFNPFHELDNTRKEEEEETAKKTKINDDEHQSTSASNSFSNSSPSPSDLDDLVAEEIIDDDDEGFYQTLNSSSHHRNDYDNEIKPLNNINNNNKYNELSDYDYLVSYEWPRTLPETTTTIPPPLPASSQPNRTQAILKFFEYN